MMSLNFEGWCRRIDLSFRAYYPHLRTRIFEEGINDFKILIADEVTDFESINSIFNDRIRLITAPVLLTLKQPSSFIKEIKPIKDSAIPSGFEGFPFTMRQLYNHFYSNFPKLNIISIKEDHEKHRIIISLTDAATDEQCKKILDSANTLKSPYAFFVAKGTGESKLPPISCEVFEMSSSVSNRELQCEFLERDESLWFDNINAIYDGTYKKENLYFFDESKKGCFVNFSLFENCNLRNFLMMYDVIYCVLPLKNQMSEFLTKQKITKDEILILCKHGRLKVLNIQPEGRMDYGFLREIYQDNSAAIISRRALSALCAIDLVEINSSYVFSDPVLDELLSPLIYEISNYVGKSPTLLSDLLLWPKKALRKSLDILNNAGPMALGNYGVHNAISGVFPNDTKDKLDFEFIVNSTSIHIAHALNATYFPFYTNDNKYSDHYYSLLMGTLLNAYKKSNFDFFNFKDGFGGLANEKNPSLGIISMFDLNDYIPIGEFEQEFSNKVIRGEVNSLFSQLNCLECEELNDLINNYNEQVDKRLKGRRYMKHGLDLTEDAIGMVVPFFATLKKGLAFSYNKGTEKLPKLRAVSEIIFDKSLSKDVETRNVNILSKINRVARLKRNYN